VRSRGPWLSIGRERSPRKLVIVARIGKNLLMLSVVSRSGGGQALVWFLFGGDLGRFAVKGAVLLTVGDDDLSLRQLGLCDSCAWGKMRQGTGILYKLTLLSDSESGVRPAAGGCQSEPRRAVCPAQGCRISGGSVPALGRVTGAARSLVRTCCNEPSGRKTPKWPTRGLPAASVSAEGGDVWSSCTRLRASFVPRPSCSLGEKQYSMRVPSG